VATETAEQPTHKVTDSGVVLVPLKLAHPFSEANAQRVQAEDVRDYEVGETIWVSREWGNALVDAGRVQVDPVDRKARQQALLLNRRNQPLTVKEIAARFGKGEDSDAEVTNAGDADAAVAAKVNEAPSKAKTAGK
jgi:hypothetical protein